jgi:hypothetical protein
MHDQPDKRDIRVTYSTFDRYRESRRFKTLKGARAYAQRKIGVHPEISVTFHYAVSAYGDAKIEVRGATLAELFPPRVAKQTA